MEILYLKTLLLTVLTLAILPGAMSSTIVKSFEENQVVPDVIPVAPKKALQITYPSGSEVNEGKELTPTNVKNAPSVEWETENGSYYTLIMTDPDAPSRAKPIRREFLHWLVVNIPGSDIDNGVTLVEYVGSGPPQGTGLHRYTFLVYKQGLGKIDFTEPKVNKTSAEGRPEFRSAKFAEKYSLGNPIAGNFYQAQYDDYVPTVHKQLGF